MPRHIGIVACSAEGAALCYRTICAEGAARFGPHAHPEVSMHTPSLSLYVERLERGDWRGVGELMLRSAEKLARIGAEFLICPDNTIHAALPAIRDRSPLPWLHIAEAVVDAAVEKGHCCLGVTGTLWLVESDVYPNALAARGLACLRAGRDEEAEIHRIIIDELTYGVFRPESIQRLQAVLGRLKQKGCDAVILGCTELPLVIGDANAPQPVLDSTRLLARAALRRAIGELSDPPVPMGHDPGHATPSKTAQRAPPGQDW